MEDHVRSGVFSFGPYRLYPTTRTLMRGELAVAVGSRAFDMLVALVKRQGEVISRRELMSLAWPGLNVEDSNVRVQMAHLRRELRFDANDERYIVSVAGRGYCFVAVAEWQEAVPNELALPITYLDARAANSALPVKLPNMIGRDENLAELLQTVEERRFVTVVGPGGVGKTTLVLRTARELSSFDRIHFVDLSSAEDSTSVIETIASSIGLNTQSLISEVTRHFAAYRTLVILDNCEHVIDEVAYAIAPMLDQASEVHIVATSREAFRLPGEAVYLVRPLGVPPQTGRLTAKQALVFPAVQLFLERASDGGYHSGFGDHDAAVVASICRRLDGNPLAIELVASRIGSYGLEGVAELLDNKFALSWRGNRYAHPRHQTVQSMLDWSYMGLSEFDQKALRRLSIFSGEFSLEAAVAVVGDDYSDETLVLGAVGNLVDKSLLVLQPGGGPPKLRLSGITKTYAAIKLAERGEYPLVYQRLAAFEFDTPSLSGMDRTLVLEDEPTNASAMV